jgi:hypothetical protein
MLRFRLGDRILADGKDITILDSCETNGIGTQPRTALVPQRL